MLARSAEGLYWMGRYLERAGHLSRLLRLQSEALVDKPIGEIYAGWTRIYRSLDRQPPGGSLEVVSSDDFALADSFTLADDLTFEPSNRDSIRSCFYMGRENARRMRHCITGEMWLRLNLAYLGLQERSIGDIWRTSPEGFYAEMEAEVDTFMGTADATMYRDLGWRFVQLGRFIERTQLRASLLITQLALDGEEEEQSESDWTGLLRLYHALEAYNRIYSVEVLPARALDLLATDPLLPDSIGHSVDRVSEELEAIGPGLDDESVAAAGRLSGRLSALVHHHWPDSEDRAAILEQVDGGCSRLHELVTAAYFREGPPHA